jgi:hypothetical protein
MTRLTPLLILALVLLAPTANGQQASKAAQIQNAVSAAPPSISAGATLLAWPTEHGEMAVLREGTNEWTCLPDMPGKTGSAMCLDAPWMEWADA